MAENSQRPKGQAGLVSALNVAIEALNLAKEISSITPAKAVFGSVSVLLAMINVSFPPVLLRGLLANLQSGFYEQLPGLHRDRAQLCRYLYSPWPGNGREETGRPQPVGVRGDKSIDDVG